MADQELLQQYFSGTIYSFFSCRESNLKGGKSEEKEAMAKQVKVSLKFEIEEVCLSIFLSGWSSYSSYGSEFFLKFTAKGKLWEQFSDVSRVI